MKILKQLLSFLIIVGVFGYIFNEINANWSSLKQINWFENIGIVVVHLCGLVLMQILMCVGWSKILKAHHTVLDVPSLAYSFFIPNMGKYLPGKVLFIAGRVELTHRLVASRVVGLSTFLFECIFVVLAAAVFIPACLFSLIEVPIVLQILIYVVLVVAYFVFTLKPQIFLVVIDRLLEKLRQKPLAIKLHAGDARNVLVLYVLIWCIYGGSCALLAIALVDIAWDHFFIITAAFVVSWLVGFLSILTPGGLGVRETILVVILQTMMDVSMAMLIAVIARLTWTIVELGISSFMLLVPVSFVENKEI